MSMWIISPSKVFSSRTISIFGSRLARRLNPLALPMRATVARDSPVSRATVCPNNVQGAANIMAILTSSKETNSMREAALNVAALRKQAAVYML
jgi:hypothetical protein